MSKYEKYTLPVGSEEEERLRSLNRDCNPYTLRFIENYLTDLSGKTVLDIGCGSAIMTGEWARRVGPHGKAVGLDISEEQISLGKRHIDSLDIQNVEFLIHPAHQIKELKEKFDIVYSRFMLEHIENQDDVIQQMIQLLKPGGVIFLEAVTSYEAMYADPTSEAFEDYKKLCLQQPKIFGTNFYLGKTLYSQLKKQGLEIVGQEICQPILRKKNEKLAICGSLKSDSFRDVNVKAGITTKEEFDSIIKHFYDEVYSCDDCLVTFPQYIQICARM